MRASRSPGLAGLDDSAIVELLLASGDGSDDSAGDDAACGVERPRRYRLRRWSRERRSGDCR